MIKTMDAPFKVRLGWARGNRENASDPDVRKVKPYGPYGGGLIKGNPIGLLVVVGMLVIFLAGVPEARVFFAASLVLGGLVGLGLWLKHR